MIPSAYLRLICLAVLWSASFLFIRIAAPVIGAIPTAFLYMLLAAIGLLVILVLLRVRLDFRGKLPRCMLLGWVNAGIPAVMYSLGGETLPAGYLSILNATTPLLGALIGSLFFAEKMTLKKGLGVFIGLFGVSLLTSSGPLSVNPQVFGSVLACLLASTCYGLSGYLAKHWLDPDGGLDNRLAALGSVLGASLMLLPLFCWSILTDPPESWGNPAVWLSVLGLGLLCTAYAYVLYFGLLSEIGALRTMAVTFLIPPFGVLWGVLLLDEPLSWAYLYGGSLIVLALYLVLKPSHPRT